VGALIMTDRTKAAAAAPVEKPTRTADEQALVDAWQAKTRLDWPPRLKDGEEPGTVVADTKDMPLWGARLAKALGVDEPWLLDMLLNQAANCMPGKPARAASVAIAAVQSVGPRDGVEAMLAVQMAATHAVAMKMLNRAMQDQPSIEIYDSVVNRATKLLRTYTMQVEALKRYRSAGEQRVVVQHQHVNVTAEQAAVQVNGGADPAAGGRGAASKSEERAHAPGETRSVTSEPDTPMLCPDPTRDTVSAAGCGRAEAVPDARRS
jgi:proteasome lid subunit RPN8/RPN11